jgi:hypothetical protein
VGERFVRVLTLGVVGGEAMMGKKGHKGPLGALRCHEVPGRLRGVKWGRGGCRDICFYNVNAEINICD